MIWQKFKGILFSGAVSLAAPLAWADVAVPPAAGTADILFLGEQHDNPAHHALQATWVETLAPAALVFEMLTPAQAVLVTDDNRTSEEDLNRVLQWEESGWPDFEMYFPIFAAAPQAAIYGAAIPREQVRGMMQQELTGVFGAADAARFGLDRALDPEQQTRREALQAEAHCDALPENLLPVMVSVQRLRDAALARAALEAFEQTGGPVVVITGNGHARADWGAPVYLRHAAPDIALFSLAQGEEGAVPAGQFDAMADGPGVDRGNPCDAFN